MNPRKTLQCDTSGIHSGNDSIPIGIGTQYSLVVRHAGAIIATGSAIMPSEPGVLSPANGSRHSINTDLPVKWTAVNYATNVLLAVYYSDSLTRDTLVFASDGLSPSDTVFTVPASVFSKAGIYAIDMAATYGLPVGIPSPLTHSMISEQSLIISGSAGICAAVDYVKEQDTIWVNYAKPAI